MAVEMEVFTGNAPVIIGARGMDDVMQCIRTIVRTMIYSVPLDRGFASTGSYIDSPSPHAVAARMGELTEAIERREPRVRVTSIRFVNASYRGAMPPDNPPSPLRAKPGTGLDAQEVMDGRLTPVIRFRLREGVSL